MKKIELHLHTAESSSCGKVPASRMIDIYHEAGYDAVVITDHFSKYALGTAGEITWEAALDKFLAGYREAKRAAAAYGMKVYLAAEYRFAGSDNDYLVFGASEEFFREHPFSYDGSLMSFRKTADQNKLIIVQAHPFRTNCTPAAAEYLDGAELFNAHPGHNSHNAEAERWILQVKAQRKAAGIEKPFCAIVGSDYHQEWQFSGTCVYAEELPEDEQALRDMILREQFVTEMPSKEEKLKKEAEEV